jgi:hypothetical protein
MMCMFTQFNSSYTSYTIRNLFVKSQVESRDVPKKVTQYLYDFRFSRRFVLVLVAYLSSSEAYTYNWGLFEKNNYLAFDWWKHIL